ncbi:S-adenosyl-L-methionine-dependent methyltransferase [Gymnopilus junonius]|uniref:S-adenosyl-L-methionine-dependent methyltransferase n=1 Tax=Gymnopilus junonius TaxID=109634 RepID=A0A9P5NTN2_GYMJU|nr:S-adenosyl-L-methionine-dependent methyltransferase [Gymnopilus junonius]
MASLATSEEMANLNDLVGHSDQQNWEKAWEANVLPWDKLGAVQPPLQALLLSDEQVWPRVGRALVPGCGRGYDAIFIAKTLGLDTLAVDISPTAIQSAHALLASSPAVSPGRVTFREMDFFAFAVPDNELFDLIYDYTFFVAIPPSKRAAWAEQMGALIKPGGFLIALIFPMNPQTDDGPPFFTRPDHYFQVLGSNWEKVIDRVPNESEETHIGFEHMVVWKKL